MDKNRWGIAFFGKRDGFEILHISGALASLDPSQVEQPFSQAVQLKLEEIRIFENTEILGYSLLPLNGSIFYLYTLYVYHLDNYQRDGYRACTLALKDSWAPPAYILDFLKGQMGGFLSGQVPDFQFPVHHIKPQLLPNPNEGVVFIPLFGEKKDEQVALLDALQQGKFELGTRFFASSSQQVQASTVGSQMMVYKENPFWVPRRVLAPETAVVLEGNALTPSSHHSLNEAPKDSLIYAVEEGEKDRWGKKAETHSSPGNKRINNIWIGTSLIIVGMLGILTWLMLS
ncbi:MAG: hypothetical protein AAFY71_09495 [Bacteroidota bacterium]